MQGLRADNTYGELVENPDPYAQFAGEDAQTGDQTTQADVPGGQINAWSNLRFALSAFARRIETVGIPVAEFGDMERGGVVPDLQHGSIVAGNAALHNRIDRIGPFYDPHLSQQAIEDYLASAIPAQVSQGQQQTINTAPYTELGFGF